MTTDAIDPAPPPSPGCPAHGDRVPLYGPDFAAGPPRFYAELRKYGPVAPVELAPGVPATLVTSYSAALDVLRDAERFPKDARRWQKGVPADCPVLPIMMYRPTANLTDGTVHHRLRQAVADSLAQVDVDALRGYIARGADTLIDRFISAGEADLRTEYAFVLPLMVFNEICGCPPDLGERLVAGMSGIIESADAENANQVLGQAVAELVALKRREPGTDVVSRLMAHPAQLNDEEVGHQIVMLLGAGTEPEQNLIANTLRLLLSNEGFARGLSATPPRTWTRPSCPITAPATAPTWPGAPARTPAPASSRRA